MRCLRTVFVLCRESFHALDELFFLLLQRPYPLQLRLLKSPQSMRNRKSYSQLTGLYSAQTCGELVVLLIPRNLDRLEFLSQPL